MITLAARYCLLHRIRPEDFATHLLRRTLYPRARWVHFLLERIPDYFAADLELIEAVGRLEDAADLAAEVAEFHYHPANLGRLRRDWRMRLSVTRLQGIVEATLEGRVAAVESRAPFAVEDWSPTDGPEEQGWGVAALLRHWRDGHHHPHA